MPRECDTSVGQRTLGTTSCTLLRRYAFSNATVLAGELVSRRDR